MSKMVENKPADFGATLEKRCQAGLKPNEYVSAGELPKWCGEDGSELIKYIMHLAGADCRRRGQPKREVFGARYPIVEVFAKVEYSNMQREDTHKVIPNDSVPLGSFYPEKIMCKGYASQTAASEWRDRLFTSADCKNCILYQ